jgi:phospholipid/cholesterol/gamma-HCH transport system substrate-binding protein
MESTKRNAKVGLFMLIGLLIFAALIFVISNMRKVFISKISAEAVFENVNGLNPGNNVRFSGVKVGAVKSLSFVPGQGVKVFFQIEEKSRKYIFKDAVLSIGSDGLIGNPILIISGGNVETGVIEDGHVFQIKKEDSQQDMLATLQQNNKNILAITEDLKGIIHAIAAGEGNVGKLLKEESLYTQLNTTLGQLQASSYQIAGFSKNLNSFGADLNNPNNLPYQFVHDNTLLPSLKRTAASLEATGSTAKQTLGEANLLVTDIRQDLNKILENENSTLGVLLHDKGTADQIKQTMINVESGTAKLDENMEALKHSIFFRRYFRKKAKQEAKESGQ